MIIRRRPSCPWQDIALDILGPVHSSGLQVFLLVIVDMYSHWPEVFFTSMIDSAHVIKCLNELFSREGVPESILTDNGVQLISKEMKDFYPQKV